MRALILGGVRSGKSAHGESLLSKSSQIRYLATGPALSTDADWQARVDAHRARRSDRYVTVESTDLVGQLEDHPAAPTLVDDLGNWLAAQLDSRDAWTGDVDLSGIYDQLCSAIAAFTGDLVIISPEVGLSVVPPTPAGRRFQDELGALNAAVARVCDRVELVVAGRILPLPQSSDSAAAQSDSTSARAVPQPAKPMPIPVPPPAAAPPAVSGTGIPDPTDAEIFTKIVAPDATILDQARARQLTLTKPAGSLGRLEDLGNWIAACQGTSPPQQFSQPRVVVFAGDHGVAQTGVSAYPPEVTAQMVANIAGGGAAVNVLAARSGASVCVFDLSVDADTSPEVSRFKVRRGSGNLAIEDSLSLAEARAALAAGKQIVDELVDAGADLLIAGDMGIGNTTPAAVLIGTITGQEPVVVVGRGTGVDDAAWNRKTAAIRDGMWRARPHFSDPLSLLATVAGADLTAMAGFLAQAAVRRTPVILDGVVVTAAALVANLLAPGAVDWWLAGHRSTEPAHAFALDRLDLTPVVDLSMRLGEGSGALTVLPVVAASIDLLTSMATFDEAGVSGG
ncbi:nicotinate-nucleotide--dimethylbenzimidazole phosphoribosyltransferase [Gordonia effusa NBRC 100432]|uniref:Nicotinate-nucleotide--dimethylbenzimidazole phosphoribosyltransferase n=1 Tax=Gordonia effusa NBRC 100432 TaxID=1077974 RepID=H0QV12_9ACTN|nr:nicotinate-nucleotide--dimethylbenzimidazole phosphoribosyltransferase [Gordonia effusa]GAB16663.1 nicotinate-nucleotide--dimethylbenzimidazole phosphoribosyltransferase [Gordonia effusa NBRC 100432]